MFKKISFILLSWLIPIATSYGAIITANYTNTNSNTWIVDYTIENNSAYIIEEFSIFFNYQHFENLSILSTPADWDSILFQPDPSYPDDGLFDSLALVNGIHHGEKVSGFSLSFDWIGSNTANMSQYFEIIDPISWSAIDSGYTALASNTPVVGVPEPPVIVLLLLGLVFMGIARSTRAKGLMAFGILALSTQSYAETIKVIHATDYKLIKKERVGRTTFNFTYEVGFKNNGANYSNVTARAYSNNANMKFIDNEISITSFYQNTVNHSQDTITISVDRRKTVSLDDLSWTISGDLNEDESSLIAGQFVDEAVEGLYYTSESTSGYTDYNGFYQCKETETVTFYAGNIKLGESVCSSLVTPISLMGSDLTDPNSLNNTISGLDLDSLDHQPLDLSLYGELADERVIEVLRLLQTANDDPRSGRILIGKGSFVHSLPELDFSQDIVEGVPHLTLEDLDIPDSKKPLITKGVLLTSPRN